MRAYTIRTDSVASSLRSSEILRSAQDDNRRVRMAIGKVRDGCLFVEFCVDFFWFGGGYVSVDLGGDDGGVAEELLYCA